MSSGTVAPKPYLPRAQFITWSYTEPDSPTAVAISAVTANRAVIQPLYSRNNSTPTQYAYAFYTFGSTTSVNVTGGQGVGSTTFNGSAIVWDYTQP